MDINFQPLNGHSYTVSARVETRSVQELLGLANQSSHISLASNGAHNVVLTHPPVLLRQEGGGEQLLNRSSLTAQLNSMQKLPKQGFSFTENLVVYMIDEASISNDGGMLLIFLLGTIQQLHYKKKSANKELLWKQAVSEISQNPALKLCIENNLFNRENLSLRHYKILLSAANISESSLAHMPEIKNRKKPKNEKITEHEYSLEKESTNNSTDTEKTSAVLCHQKKPSNFEKSLGIINKAAEKAEKQFSLNVEL
ncbi:MAG: hypothetical protein IKE45_14870 [Halomonas sp.]|nr:hypothetical protein [Halomonas sp.]MBR2515264.1 hypothetical protein [Halomonas sp.]